MQTESESVTMTISRREAETIRQALRLFADGGYRADYSDEEFEIYFSAAMESLRHMEQIGEGA